MSTRNAAPPGDDEDRFEREPEAIAEELVDERSDRIDSAIAAVAGVDESEAVVNMVGIPVTFASTGRPAIVEVPNDMTDQELVDLLGWLATSVRAHVKATREAQLGPRLVVARSLPPLREQ